MNATHTATTDPAVVASPSAQNKAQMQAIFAALAQGDGKPFVDAMADDFSWTIAGHSSWSRSWHGKHAVRNQLLRPLFARFATTYVNHAQRFIAEDDLVVVECRGDVQTHAGRRYHNAYCYICRFAGGQLRELTEYMDTEHAIAVLGPPDPAA